jgi:LPS sulfotransferase NodH
MAINPAPRLEWRPELGQQNKGMDQQMKTQGAYIICTAPRSGSTLLCRMLKATGIAGDPSSLFYRPAIDDWADRLGVPAEGRTERDHLAALIAAALERGRGGTPVFGLRQQRASFAYLCEKLAVLHPEAKTDRDRIERSFGPTRFIHLTRADKLSQAISLLKAQQTGLWHVAVDGSELERTDAPRTPEYDAAAISDTIATLTDYDRGWANWFAQQAIEPIRLTYDDLAEAPTESLCKLLDTLSLDPTAANTVTPDVKKMADTTTESWAARFLEEEG